jgi:hypothetical protein
MPTGYKNKYSPKIYSEEYGSWQEMKNRCYNQNYHHYYAYGGRGIEVCDRWKNSFDNFYEDMGPRLPGFTLNRSDNDGDYEPSNCEWSTRKEQQRNRINSPKLKGKDLF